MNIPQFALLVTGLFHLLVAAGEMLPFAVEPLILQRLFAKTKIQLPERRQADLVAAIFRYAGVYNLILAVGYFWSMSPGIFGGGFDAGAVRAVQAFFLLCSIATGLFGLTLHRANIIQAVLGMVGLVLVFVA